MRTLLIALALGSTLCSIASAAGTAAPAQKSAAQTSQQDKMKRCNAEAKGKHGDERRAFMSECLSKKPKA